MTDDSLRPSTEQGPKAVSDLPQRPPEHTETWQGRPLSHPKTAGGVSDEHAAKTLARFERHIGPMREAARAHGYALAVHGSLRRDIDLIAAPWWPDASEPDVLIAALVAACGGWMKTDPNRTDRNNYLHHSPEPKPHGRLGYQIIPGDGHTYFDVSVLPCAESHAHAEEIEAAKRLGYAEAISDGIVAKSDLSSLLAEKGRLETELRDAQKDRDAANFFCHAMDRARQGEASDFDLSYPEVRAIDDLRFEKGRLEDALQEARKELKTLRDDPRGAVSDKKDEEDARVDGHR